MISNKRDKHIAIAGTIDYSSAKFNYNINVNIKHEKDITIVYWFSNDIIITNGKDDVLALWNYGKGEKVVSINGLSLGKILRVENRFMGISNKGSIYEWKKPELLKASTALDEALK